MIWISFICMGEGMDLGLVPGVLDCGFNLCGVDFII
jgi:hypothetical protein